MMPPVRFKLFLVIILTYTIISGAISSQSTDGAYIDGSLDQTRKNLGQSKLREIQGKTHSSICWKEAVSRLNSTCKQLTDIQQSQLAVAFANCHLGKSGRTTYHCNDTMTIEECTRDMDPVAFQTYTEFFTHTGHICYFLQNELWQERTQNVISKLSSTSSETVVKLEESLRYHKELDQKQNQALDNQAAILDQDRRIASSLDDTRHSMDRAFNDMNQLAEKHKMILTEMFGTLQGSIDGVRYLMSLFLIEFVGYETFAVFVVSCLVIIFLPQFGYSRLKLYLLLFVEVVLEILVRRLYGYFVLWVGSGGGAKPPLDSLEALHTYLWWCRYLYFFLSFILYLWEWLRYRDPTLLLSDIQQNTDLIMERLGIDTPTSKARRASASARMQGAGGPPPPEGVPTPARHSWPVVGRVVNLNGKVPPEAQPSGLTNRDIPADSDLVADVETEGTDGCMFSKKRMERDTYNPPPGERPSNAYVYDPIQGLDPPVGHSLSPYTNRRISDYIASLPAHFDSSGEESFISNVAVPPDSDTDKSTCGSNNTVILSESPFARQPIRGNKTSLSPNRPPTGHKNKIAGPSPSGRSGFRQRRLIPNNDPLANIPLSNRPVDWGPEKEIEEEKPEPKGNAGSTTRPSGWSRKTEPVNPTFSSSVVATPPPTRRHTLQAPTQSTNTPRRYNLRPRSIGQTPTPSPFK